MGKYDKYKKAVDEDVSFGKNQDKLHRKHPEIEEKAVIIEKSNTVKFILSFIQTFIKTLLSMVFILLAAVGIMTILYPTIRNEFFIIIAQIWDEIMSMI